VPEGARRCWRRHAASPSVQKKPRQLAMMSSRYAPKENLQEQRDARAVRRRATRAATRYDGSEQRSFYAERCDFMMRAPRADVPRQLDIRAGEFSPQLRGMVRDSRRVRQARIPSAATPSKRTRLVAAWRGAH